MLLNIFYHGLGSKLLFNKLYNNLEENSLLLIQDAVYFGLFIKDHTITTNIYALKIDVDARGLLDIFNTMHNIKLINYDEFVDLILKHDQNITW